MIGKRRLRKYKSICDSLGVRLVILNKNSKKNPSWKLSNATIYIKEDNDLRYLDSSFCHEIGHVLCCLYGIYPTFHGLNNVSKKQKLKAKLCHGITAERYVDNVGAMLKKELNIGKHKYYYGYSTKWAKEWYLKKIKKHIEKLNN